jgi:hypothetical protein
MTGSLPPHRAGATGSRGEPPSIDKHQPTMLVFETALPHREVACYESRTVPAGTHVQACLPRLACEDRTLPHQVKRPATTRRLIVAQADDWLANRRGYRLPPSTQEKRAEMAHARIKRDTSAKNFSWTQARLLDGRRRQRGVFERRRPVPTRRATGSARMLRLKDAVGCERLDCQSRQGQRPPERRQVCGANAARDGCAGSCREPAGSRSKSDRHGTSVRFRAGKAAGGCRGRQT